MAGGLLRTRTARGTTVRGATGTFTIGRGVILAGPEPEMCGCALRSRFVPGVIIRHDTHCRRIGHPAIIGGPEPVVPGYSLGPRVYFGVRVEHDTHSRRHGHPAIIGGPEPVIPGYMLGTRVFPGRSVYHDAHTRRHGHPSQFATPEPEVPGFMLSSRVVRGVRVRHRSARYRTGHPFQHGAFPPYLIPSQLAPTVLRGVRVQHESRPVRIGHPGIIGGPEPEVPGFMLASRFVPGVRVQHKARSRTISPRLIELGRRYHDGRGKYRVFNAAGYRFYRSNSSPPAESDTPFATNATLPHEPSDTYADGTWYLSVSYFNGVLDSGFLPLGPHGETYLRLDLSGGEETIQPPKGPNDWRLEACAGGVVCVVGFYFESDDNRADQWAIAYTTDGSDPPADTPDANPAVQGNLSVLGYDLPAQSHDTTVKVRLQTRRNDGTAGSPDWVYSEGSTILTLSADAQGPAAPPAATLWTGQLPEEV